MGHLDRTSTLIYTQARLAGPPPCRTLLLERDIPAVVCWSNYSSPSPNGCDGALASMTVEAGADMKNPILWDNLGRHDTFGLFV